MRKILGVGMAACGAMLIVQKERDAKTVPHWTFQIGVLAFGLLALLVSLPSSVCAAAERRVQIGFVSFTSNNAPLWVAADRGFFAQEGLDPECVFRPKSAPIPLANRHSFRLKSALVPVQIGTPV